jgi:hypothetical protein
MHKRHVHLNALLATTSTSIVMLNSCLFSPLSDQDVVTLNFFAIVMQ